MKAAVQSAAARRRAFVQSVQRAWLDEQPIPTVARSVERLFRMDVAFVYDFGPTGAPAAVGHTFDESGDSWSAFRNYQQIPRYARYGPSDRFRNRPVTTRELFANDPEGLERARSDFWGPNDVHFQLRVALYEGDRIVGMVAALRQRRSAEFAESDVLAMAGVVECLQDVFAVSHLLRDARSNLAVLPPVLDAFGEPAFLVTPAGAAVHANVAARRAFPQVPEWLAITARNHCAVQSLVRRVPVDLEGKTVFLVRPSERLLTGQRRADPDALPPYLRPIARRLALGMSDKEIAQDLEIPLATTRTYVTRCLGKLGLTSRRQLM